MADHKSEDKTELTPGQKRARTNLGKDPNYYKRLGRKAGLRTQELYGSKVQPFRDRALARKAGKKGLKTQGKA